MYYTNIQNLSKSFFFLCYTLKLEINTFIFNMNTHILFIDTLWNNFVDKMPQFPFMQWVHKGLFNISWLCTGRDHIIESASWPTFMFLLRLYPLTISSSNVWPGAWSSIASPVISFYIYTWKQDFIFLNLN